MSFRPLSETLANDPTDPEPDGRSATLEDAAEKVKAMRGRDLLWTPTPGQDMTKSLFPGAPRIGAAAERIEAGDLLRFDPAKTPNAPVHVVGRAVPAAPVVGRIEHFDPLRGEKGEWVAGPRPRKSSIGADGKLECARDDGGKARLDLIPVGPLFEVARLYAEGAKKYEVDQWRNGLSFRRAAAAMLRHAFKWLGGQTVDPENGCSHLAAVVFWAFALMEWTASHPEKDDRVIDPVFAKEGFPRS